ncbi:MAG: rhamnulokinase family protein [Planctomycetota bacterium]
MHTAHLAIDLGASSGRAIVGVLTGDEPKLLLEEVHRFEHFGSPTPVGPVWDLTGIWRHILTGVSKAATWCRDEGYELKSVGVDTWAVDWVVVGPGGELLGLPHCYRDPQNEAACERVIERLGGFGSLYKRTGIQRLPFNTLFQLEARHAAEPRLFDAASRLLMLPDLLHYWLSGEQATERSNASSSSMLDVHTGDWDFELLKKLGLPTDILGPIVEPGTDLGAVRADVAAETGVDAALRVVAPATHDTASAVAAAPATGDTTWAYLSSGTWSLLGAEIREPILTDAAQQAPFTHERGVEGTIRFLKNIAGLWLVQELRRELASQANNQGAGAPTFGQLVEEAQAAAPFRTLVNPNQPDFATPGDMIGKLRRFARDTDQPEPETTGQLVRCCLESLALSYRDTLDRMEPILGHSVESLHMVGGGTQNRLLNQLTASAVGRTTTSGPVEATAIGNVLVQAIGCGTLADLAEVRSVVRRSFEIETVDPGPPTPPEAYERFATLLTS